jgi:hypothetical protein
MIGLSKGRSVRDCGTAVGLVKAMLTYAYSAVCKVLVWYFNPSW